MADLAGVDMTPIIQAVGSVGVIVVTGVITWAGQRLIAYYNLQVSASQQAAFSDAISKAATYGVTASEAVISAKGWDHVDSKSAIIDAGLAYAVSRFPAALKAVGLTTDLTDPANVAKIQAALQRVLPAVTTAAAASPSTPPAPNPAAVIVAPAPTAQ